MKTILSCMLLIAGAGLVKANIVESISLDLSKLNAGSTLSGTFTLSDSPMVGDTATVLLSFSDPADYSPTSLTATITIGNGTVDPFTVAFSALTFTNLNGHSATPDTRDVFLTASAGRAQCPSFPCTSTGGFEDRNPAVFTANYTITPVSVPEPTPLCGLIPVIGAVGLMGKRRRSRTKKATDAE
jgi:hypothetical protein